MTSPALEPDVASRIEAVALAGIAEPCLAFPRERHAAFRRRPARVDVLVPVWNGGVNLDRCIASVLGQTWSDLHLVIVDNVSTDDTFARCCRWADSDERVVAYQNARNVGRVPNWNRCLELTSAEYAKLLMVNDLLLPPFLAELVAALDAQPAAAMARASLTLLEADGTTRFSPYFNESTFLPAPVARMVSLVRDNVAGCPAAQLLRRSVVASRGLRFDEALSWAADYDFSARLFEHGGLSYVRKDLFRFDAGAARFFKAGDLVVRFRDECAVRTRAVEAGVGLDAAAVSQIRARVAQIFGGYAAQAPSPAVRAELERAHEEAQRAMQPPGAPQAQQGQQAQPQAAQAQQSPAGLVHDAAGGGVPRVSVVIPCYKQACFLPEAVASLVEQTFTDWECIIVNDGSPDDTAAVAEALIARYAPRAIRLINQENRGLSEARNTGVRASRGRYVLPLDSDDMLTPTMLARLVAILDQKADVSIAFTHAQCFGVQTGVWRCGPFTLDKVREANRIPYCSLYRRGVWDAVGGYNPNLNAYEDWDFWVGAAERGFRAEGTEEALFLYRTKAVSMLTEAEARKPQLTARLVLNHPHLFPPETESGARRILPQAGAERRPPASPRVSVVVLRRAGGEAFARTLRSVLGQSFQDFEVVVVNDGDASGEAQVAEIDRGARATYVCARRGRGRAAARNAGLRAATGRRVAYADEGDLVYPAHLAALARAADESGAAVVYGDVHRAGEGGPPPAEGRAVRALALSAHAGGDVFTAATRLPLVCLLHDRALLEAVSGFDESLGAFEEWDFQIRLLAAAPPQHVAEVIGEVGPHPDEARAARSADAKELVLAARALIRRKHEARFAEADRRRSERYDAQRARADTLIRAGDVPAGIAVMETCVRDMPYWAPAHNQLAVLYRSAGKLPEALASIVAALELEPTSTVIWQNARAIQQAVEASRAGRAAPR